MCVANRPVTGDPARGGAWSAARGDERVAHVVAPGWCGWRVVGHARRRSAPWRARSCLDADVATRHCIVFEGAACSVAPLIVQRLSREAEW